MPDFDFSTLITDRSASDLELLRDLLSTPMSDWTAEQLAAFNLAASKGAYNYTDLNRVTACMDYLNERLTALGYVTGYQRLVVHPEEPPGPVGPLPDGYTELEYIESTGTQYIDTGFQPNQDTRIVMDVEPLRAGSFYAVFGGCIGSRESTFAFWLVNATSARSDYGAAVVTQTVSSVLSRTTIDKDKNICQAWGHTITNTAVTFQSNYSIVLFSINTSGTIDNRRLIGRLYSCQLYDNGTLIRDYVPCVDPTGNVGLYDRVNAQFYSNAGSGAFTAGPEVPPPEPEPTLDPYTWYEADIPTVSTMEAYLGNVEALRSVLTLPEDTAQVPGDMAGLTPTEANQIEEILSVIHAYLEAMVTVFRRCGAAICGGPGFYFVN